ncbi:MAG: tetraacyldisaccharide 4'-kinase [Bdellovibrionota bacterium]
MIRTVLTPFSSVYAKVMSFRNSLYDNETLAVSKIGAPVISVGNITVGGTGKTPFVLGLLDWAHTQGIDVGVVSRGYKSAGSHPRKVDIQMPDAPHLFGDEPTLIAMKNQAVPVYVGTDRVEVGKKLLNENKVKLVIADDAFQHRRLHRDIDIVLIDALGQLSKEALLPAGRLREPCIGLSRAHYVVITRANLISNNKLESLKKEIRSFGFTDDKIIEDRLEIKACYEVRFPSKERRDTTVDRIPQPALLMSAIGQPKSFELLLENNQIKFKKHFIFQDHHGFTDQDVAAIIDSKEAKSARCVLTTEKDIVKLTELELTLEDWGQLPVFVIEVYSSYSENIRKLHDAIIGLAR